MDAPKLPLDYQFDRDLSVEGCYMLVVDCSSEGSKYYIGILFFFFLFCVNQEEIWSQLELGGNTYLPY